MAKDGYLCGFFLNGSISLVLHALGLIWPGVRCFSWKGICLTKKEVCEE
jgi:hypothetical protein